MSADGGLKRLLADLHQAASGKVTGDVEKVVKKAATNIKRDWRANARGTAGRHAARYPYSITFDDVRRNGLTVEVEIGPDKGKRQGALGNLLEYGSARNAPHNDGLLAAQKEAPRFEKALGDVAAGVWEIRTAGKP